MICWQINVADKTIESVEIPNIPEGYEDDPQYLNEMGDVVYIKRDVNAEAAFVIEGIRTPVAGCAYVSGTNEDGDDVPPKVALDWLIENVDFGAIASINDAMRLFTGERNVRQVQ